MSSVPAQPFLVSARENASDKTDYACTGKRPTWINNMLAKGHEVDLPTLIFQAGRHFADRVNSSVLTGSSTKREKAAALAWALISMIDPFIKNNRLWVSNPNDQDSKRLCSQILGVGAGLELLTALNVIDGRTIRKQSNRFDFDANTPDGKKRVYIEAKGTFNGVSSPGHRDSFKEKLGAPKIITSRCPRGYGRAVGIISSIWSEDVKRRADVELLDPEQEAGDTTQEAVREIIRFYARAFDEIVGKAEGAKLLLEVADSENLFQSREPIDLGLDGSGRFPMAFHRSTVRLIEQNQTKTFLGGFLEG